MDLTSRHWSLNTYTHTKVWFKFRIVDPSKFKSWRFKDQVTTQLYPHERIKALATLIITLMEIAANPLLTHSLIHTLYRN